MNAQRSGKKKTPADGRDQTRRRLHGIHDINPMERKSGEKSWAASSSGAKTDQGGNPHRRAITLPVSDVS